jgi:hypothetical protein
MSSTSIDNKKILKNRHAYYQILRNSTNDNQEKLDLESNKKRYENFTIENGEMKVPNNSLVILEDILKFIDSNKNSSIEQDEFVRYYKSILPKANDELINNTWNKLSGIDKANLTEIENGDSGISNSTIKRLKNASVAITQNPYPSYTNDINNNNFIDNNEFVPRDLTHASGVVTRVVKNVDGKDFVYILTAEHVPINPLTRVVFANGLIGKPELLPNSPELKRADIAIIRVSYPTSSKTEELEALTISDKPLQSKDHIIKAGYPRELMEPVCKASSKCLPSSLDIFKQNNAAVIVPDFGEGSLFSSPILIVDENVIQSLSDEEDSFKRKFKTEFFRTEKMPAISGDSGGPIISKEDLNLIGLVSSGNSYDLNTNVKSPNLVYYKKEIESIIQWDLLKLRRWISEN